MPIVVGSDARNRSNVSLTSGVSGRGLRSCSVLRLKVRICRTRFLPAHPGLEYLSKVMACPHLFRHLVYGQLRVTDDDREDVIEVMGDAACQGAYCLHLVCLAELFLDLCPLGHLRFEVLVGLCELGCPLLDPLLQFMASLIQGFFRLPAFGNVVDDGEEYCLALRLEGRGIDIYPADPAVSETMREDEVALLFRSGFLPFRRPPPQAVVG